MKTFYSIASLMIQIGLGFAPIYIVKAALATKAGIGKIINGASRASDSITGKARQRAQSSNYYQNKELTRQARATERRRGNIAAYTDLMSGNSLRSEMARRSAAGGIGAQIFNTNQAGQERIRAAAEDQLRKERHEEAQRAAKTLAQQGFEGDADFMSIARNTTGTYTSARTGATVQVTDAVRQAAVNALVQQGRTQQIRDLEADGGGRGPGGVGRTEMHEILDHAYEDYGQKLGDKAPDLMPSRRTTEGRAAFTDLKATDVADWHHSTVRAANTWYTATTDSRGAALSAAEMADRRTEQARMVRAFAEATRQPGTRSKLSREQLEQAVDVMNDAIAAGATFDPRVVTDINDTYTTFNG